MKTFILFLAILALPLAAQAAHPPLGDLGKPADYQATLRDFSAERRTRDALPSSFDWRTSGKVTVAKNQGGCGGCWSFASAGVLESRILMAGGGTYDLSEQQVISCNSWNYGCNGGSMNALQFWYSQGPMLESCTGYPSSGGSKPACSTLSSCSELNARTSGYYTVDTGSASAVKTALSTDGPAYFRFEVYSDFDTYWNNGASGAVYTHTGGSSEGGHAVLLIGWDDAKNAWLLKNSWGATAGPNRDGTFWMAYSGHATDLSFGMASVKASWSASATSRAPVPALSWPGEAAMGLLLFASALYVLRRRVVRKVGAGK
jgi:C1A family cysteine protease